jgi:hypothetical protein
LHTTVLLENQKARDSLGDVGREGRIILRLILRKKDVRVRTEFSWLKQGLAVGCCEHIKATTIKDGQFLFSWVTDSF